MESNTPIINLPTTKKAVFYQIKKQLFDNTHRVYGLYSVLGPRRVGKTILLQQLCQEYNGYYFSVEELKVSAREFGDYEKMKKLFFELLQEPCELICIDEITQMPGNLYGIMSHYLKLVRDKIVIVTGSIPSSVEDFTLQAGLKGSFYLHSLNYWEYCNWKQESVDSRSFKKFLELKHHEEIPILTDYAKSVLSCSKQSYHGREMRSLDDLEEIESIFRHGEFEKLLKLVCLSGQFKLSSKSRFEDLPNLPGIEPDRFEEFTKLKQTILKNENKIAKLSSFLEETGLGEEVYLYNYAENLRAVNPDYSMKGVRVDSTFLTFEFPCFGSSVFGTSVVEDHFDYEHQCEVYVFNQLCKFFHYPGKFRHDNKVEIDFMSDEVLVEIKSNSLNHAKKHLMVYKSIAETVEINQLILTTSDDMLIKEYDETLKIEVLKVNLPQLAWVLGELECEYNNLKEHCVKLQEKPIQFLYDKIQSLRSSKGN